MVLRSPAIYTIWLLEETRLISCLPKRRRRQSRPFDNLHKDTHTQVGVCALGERAREREREIGARDKLRRSIITADRAWITSITAYSRALRRKIFRGLFCRRCVWWRAIGCCHSSSRVFFRIYIYICSYCWEFHSRISTGSLFKLAEPSVIARRPRAEEEEKERLRYRSRALRNLIDRPFGPFFTHSTPSTFSYPHNAATRAKQLVSDGIIAGRDCFLPWARRNESRMLSWHSASARVRTSEARNINFNKGKINESLATSRNNVWVFTAN